MMNSLVLRRIKDGVHRFPRGIWLMMVLDILMTMGWSIASPFLALYLHDERDLSMSLVGWVFLAGGLCTGGANIIGGMLSDRLGRRRLLIVSSALGALSAGAMAVLVAISAPTWLVAFMYVVSHSIGGIGGPTFGAIIADLSPKERLAESYAVVRTGGNFGFAIGPALGGFLVSHWSYGWVLGISAVVSAAVTVVVYLFLKESHEGSRAGVDLRSTMAVAGDLQFLVFAVASVLLVLSIAHMGSTMSVFAVDRLGFSAAQYGLLLTANGIMVMLFQYPVARWVGKLGRSEGLILGSLFYAVGYLSLGWFASFGLTLLTIALITAGEVTVSPVSSAVVAETSPPDKRGRYMGFFGLTQTLGLAISPLFGGVLLDAFPSESRLLWGIIASVGMMAAIVFHIWGRMLHRGQQVSQGEMT